MTTLRVSDNFGHHCRVLTGPELRLVAPQQVEDVVFCVCAARVFQRRQDVVT
jgi:hypothetical protein